MCAKNQTSENEQKQAQSDLTGLLGCAPYIVNTHHYGCRCGEAALIIGTTIANKEHPKPCYHVEYADGKQDFIAIEDYNNYKIVMPNVIRKAYTLTAST